MKRTLLSLLIIATVGAGAGVYYLHRNGPEVNVLTAPVTRGDIIDTVGSTGTLQAVTTVQVGSQVSGNIQFLGADFNSIVKKDEVIARLDPSLFQAQLEQSKASLNQSRANLTKAQSDLDRMKVQLLDAQQRYTRMKQLFEQQLETGSDLDSAKIAVDSAEASLASQQSTVSQSDAAITQAQASVNQNQVNLDHTIIQAPIDGIITQRSVDVGQTVAASMQAPTLFIIAADLTKMQVNASIDEADIGRIRPGQHVTFHVDAYPAETFQGTVEQIRLQPVVVQNVTTYDTVIDVPNAELKLKPGMTATVKVEVAHKTDVLRIPNAAPRFRPTTDVFAAFNQPVPPEALGGGRGGRGAGGGRGQGGGARGGAGTAPTQPATAAGANPRPDTGAAPSLARTDESAPVESASAPTDVSPDGHGQSGRSQDGGNQPGRGRGGSGAEDGASQGDRRARQLERFKAMPPDQQKQFIDRLKERGQDVSVYQITAAPTRASTSQPKYGAPQAAETIDALFAPLPPVESRGRVWLFIDKQLKPVNVRLGITDGTNTELLSAELPQNTEVVTGVTGVGNVRPQAGGAGNGNPLLGNRGGGAGRGR